MWWEAAFQYIRTCSGVRQGPPWLLQAGQGGGEGRPRAVEEWRKEERGADMVLIVISGFQSQTGPISRRSNKRFVREGICEEEFM